MVQYMMDSGKKMPSMAMAKNRGLMELCLRENTVMERKKEKGAFPGRTGPNTKVNLKTTTFQVKVSMNGAMEGSLMVNGS